MTMLFEPDGRGATEGQMVRRGIAFTVIVALVVTALIAKSEGYFDSKVGITALLSDVGDGLPPRSDVKFRGVLVGSVAGVIPSMGGKRNIVRVDLNPGYASGIPRTVTARVVPSNVFAVSSIQLVDNGPAPGLSAGAQVDQDTGTSTIQLQTALTKLRAIVAAVSRSRSDRTVGVLAAVAAATDRKGGDITRAAAQLEDVLHRLNDVVSDGDSRSTVDAFTGAVTGLAASAPDLLDAVHASIQPMRTLSDEAAQLSGLLAAGLHTAGTGDTALANHLDQIIGITGELGPVAGVFASGGRTFPAIVTSMNGITDKWFGEFWDDKKQTGTGRFLLELTPHRQFTRADCPRYGDLAGPSCATAPESADPPALPPPGSPPAPGAPPPEDAAQPAPAGLMGGNVGPVGSPQENRIMSAILGGDVNAAAQLLLGTVVRGADVSEVPDPRPGGN